MGDEDDVAGIVDEVLFEPLDALGVEMVGRLVEQQDAWLLQQQPGQRDPALLAARQILDRRLARRATQGVHRDLELVVERPAVDRVDLLLEFTHLGHQRVEIVAGVGHLRGNGVEPVEHVGNGANPVLHIFEDRLARIELRFLLEITDGDPLARPGLAGELLVAAGHDLHQRRLARPVGSDDPDLGVEIELQVDSVEDGLAARESLGQAFHHKAVLGGHGVACVLQSAGKLLRQLGGRGRFFHPAAEYETRSS